PTDTRIVVNAPAYRMDLFKDGNLTKTYKIGIGYPEFPLPAGLRRAKEIIFNPTWIPPDEPWVKGKYAPGKKVEAGSKLNPLGVIKIPIGLPSLIHGGKIPARLGTFASHGCVGLTNAMVQDFAMELASMSGTPLTLDEIKAYEKAKSETEEVKLQNSVPVELRYETIVVEDGKVTIYRDVYEKGTNTEDNLRKVLETFGVSFDRLADADQAKLSDALDRMAVDAAGDAVPEEGNLRKRSKASKVTRNIKGTKEIVVEVSALRGKGYPSPVALMTK
ncbi:MAG TPA: L,D-transpeptidase, partial [Pyrinomonadaceae bacterium]|nr:L,D-transpeptidase [Pyrinomonadaceae bacterium]